MENELEAKVLREIHMHGFMLNAIRQCQCPSSNGLLDITVALHQLRQIQKAIDFDHWLIQLHSFLLYMPSDGFFASAFPDFAWPKTAHMSQGATCDSGAARSDTTSR